MSLRKSSKCSQDTFIQTEAGTVHAKVKTSEQAPSDQQEFDLSPAQEVELAGFLTNLNELQACYLNSSDGDIGANELDAIFSGWQADEEHSRMGPQSVVNALGARFGNLLCGTLNMKWVLVVDKLGTSLAVRHARVPVYVWPFDAIWKRVNAHEHVFFASVLAIAERGLLERLSEEA
jgi:hypothetical protein